MLTVPNSLRGYLVRGVVMSAYVSSALIIAYNGTEYVVATVTAESLKCREWNNGRYFTDYDLAFDAFFSQARELLI